jgi:hypothetical protein
MSFQKYIIALVALLGLVLSHASYASSGSGDPLADQIRQKAELAVSQFQKRASANLDYSEKSLAKMEELLSEAAEYKNQMQEPEVKALVELMGSYILEVAFRKYGGKYFWHEGRNQPVLVVGQPKFKVGIMTFDKVKGRLSGDKGDNIVFFYEGFAASLKNASPGMDVLYV